MSYKVKGQAGPFLQQQRIGFDALTGDYFVERTYAGSTRAIEGQAATFRGQRTTFDAFLEERGTGISVVRSPLNKTEDIEDTVRYEINTEFVEQDIFRHKTVSDAADAFDATLTNGRTF